jgi:hypothetical protein
MQTARRWAEIAVLCGIALPGCGSASRGENPFDSATDPGGLDDGASEEGDGASGTSAGTGEADGTGVDASDDDAAGDGGGPKLDVGAPPSADDGGNPSGEGCEFIDVLFVVDISASMHEEKANLAANFPGFVAVLDDYVAAGNALGYRLGVTNSSINQDYDGCATTMGFDGVLTATGGVFGMGDCGTGGTPWLDGPAADISASFSCLAENPIPPGGGSDCGKERPLGVMERFVDASAPGGPNDGFYRGEASLFVVVNLTDEDEDQDWTDTTPAQTKAKLDAFAGGEERYVAVSIAGPMACESQFGEANEATVLKAFTDLVPNGMFGDICQGDLAQPLADALDLIQTSCDNLPPPEG